MITEIHRDGKRYRADLSRPLDISIPLREGMETVNCFYAPPLETAPVVAGDFIGSTAQGGPVNFLNVKFNPHGNGTHTECVGHIAREVYTINQCLQQFFFVARLVSLYPQNQEGDRVITRLLLEMALEGSRPAEALIIRTMPNDELKLRAHYSGANPPYLHHEAAAFIVERGIQHLLIDLPSIDREEDGGRLLAHHVFWQYPQQTRTGSTITELVFLNNSIRDGLYLLNLQIASFEIDASPSKPVLYKLEEVAEDQANT
jgi:kynurenine formamidase